jgi:hypothetical protein
MNEGHDSTDFDAWYWHDSTVHGIRFVVGDSSQDDWTSDLVLDIDFIVEWVKTCPPQFRVAPATLVFHDVTDLHIALPGMKSGYQVAIGHPSINSAERKAIEDQKVCLDRPYYSWKLTIDYMVEQGEISFGASGFDQTLRAAPMLLDAQSLPSAARADGK